MEKDTGDKLQQLCAPKPSTYTTAYTCCTNPQGSLLGAGNLSLQRDLIKCVFRAKLQAAQTSGGYPHLIELRNTHTLVKKNNAHTTL